MTNYLTRKAILLLSLIVILQSFSFAYLPPPSCESTWWGDSYPSPPIYPGSILMGGNDISSTVFPIPLLNITSDLSTIFSQAGISLHEGFDQDSQDSIHRDSNCSVTTTTVTLPTLYQVNHYAFPYNPPTVTNYGNYTIYGQWIDVGTPAIDDPAYNYFLLGVWGISGVKAVPLGGDSVKICWNSSIPTMSRVKYGLTRNYTFFSPTTDFDPNYVSNHNIILTGLSIGSTYYYGVVSKDSAGHTFSSEAYAFTLTGDSSVVSIYYLDGTSGSDVTGDGSSDNPWATFGNAIYQLSLLDNSQAELRVSQGTYTQQVLSLSGLRIKGGYPTLYSVPTTIYGQRDTDWIEKHRNPRRYETIIDPSYWWEYSDSVRIDSGYDEDFSLDGFTVKYRQNNNSWGAIFATNGSNIFISNNIVQSTSTSGYGIALGGTNTKVINNVVQGFNVGLRMGYTGSVNLQVFNNTVYKNNMGTELFGSGNTTFTFTGKVENNISIQNNIGLKAGGTLSANTVDYNCVWSNYSTNYIGITPGDHDISSNPRLVHNGNGKSDGYYLAQANNDVSKFPLRVYGRVTGIGLPTPSQFPSGQFIMVGVSYNSTSYSFGDIGYSNAWKGKLNISSQTFTQGSQSTSGTVWVAIGDYNAVSGGSITENAELDLYLDNGSKVPVIFPATYVGDYQQITFWVAMDGSVYYAQSDHDAITLDVDIPYNTQNAQYAMNSVSTELGKRSFEALGTSPCVNAGDPSIIKINDEIVVGGTATNFNRDRDTLDMGYHYNWPFIEVSANGRTFELGDGTPYIPMGFQAKSPIFEYQDAVSLPKVNEYLDWAKAHGFNSMGRGFHDNAPNPFGYPYDVNSWYSLETPLHHFNETQAVWMDQYLNAMDNHQMTYWLGLWTVPGSNESGDTTSDVYFNPNNPRAKYNFWFHDTTYFGGHAYKAIDVINNSDCIADQETTLQYYIDRWGDRAGIVLWDPLPESDYIADTIHYSSSAIVTMKTNWISQISDFIRSYELQKWGQTHMVSMSAGSANPGQSGNNVTPPPPGLPRRSMYAWSQGVENPLYSITGLDKSSTIKTYFQNPSLDIVNTHPVYVTQRILGNYTTVAAPINYPAWDEATVNGSNSLWYDITSTQWVVDSASIEVALAMHSTIMFAFSMESQNRPYLCTFMGPGDYEGPWAMRSDRLDPSTDNQQSLTASTASYLDRHIAQNLHESYTHYLGWANLLSGAAGEGYHYGMWINNFLYSNFSTVHNNDVCYKANNTDLYRNDPLNISPGREYNPLTDKMFNDQLGMYKIVTSFNWSGLTQWVNQNTTNRVTFGGSTGKGVIPFYAGDSLNLLLWLIRDTRSYDTGTSYQNLVSILTTVVQIKGFPTGTTYQLTWYDSTTGNVLGSASPFTPSSVSDNYIATAPSYYRDMVAIIKPQ